MDKDKTIVIDGRLVEYITDDLKLKLPDDYSPENYDHDEARDTRISLQLDGIKEGMPFTDEDYEVLKVHLSIRSRISDLLVLDNHYSHQHEYQDLLYASYNRLKRFKEHIDTKQVEKAIKSISNVYNKNFGKLSDIIITNDVRWLISDIERGNNREKILNELLS